MMSENALVEVDLGDGRIVLIEARGASTGEEDVGILRRTSWKGVEESITAVSERVLAAVEKVSPNSASVEFGIDVTAETGSLTGILARGSGTATLKVTLGWENTDA